MSNTVPENALFVCFGGMSNVGVGQDARGQAHHHGGRLSVELRAQNRRAGRVQTRATDQSRRRLRHQKGSAVRVLGRRLAGGHARDCRGDSKRVSASHA